LQGTQRTPSARAWASLEFLLRTLSGAAASGMIHVVPPPAWTANRRFSMLQETAV